MKYVMIIGVVISIVVETGIIIYTICTYDIRFTAVPLSGMIGLYLLQWAAGVAVFLIVCFVLKKIFKI